MGNATMVSNIVVHGHRGARGVLPENTIEAFKYALKTGVDYLELDLHATKDDVLVITHDPHLNKKICLDEKGNKIKGKIPVISLTFAELSKYDCGVLKNPKFSKQVPVKGEKIPSLKEFFDFIKTSKDPMAKLVKFNIELKYEKKDKELYPDPKKYVELLIDLVERENLEDRTLIQSFEHDLLVISKKLKPSIPIAALQSRKKRGIVDHVASLKAEYFSPRHTWVDKNLVEQFRKKGIKVVPWTANKPSHWEKLKEAGVHGIISDYPNELIGWLKKNP
jgi:glycerophosphoryl diester phosphodiesterase